MSALRRLTFYFLVANIAVHGAPSSRESLVSPLKDLTTRQAVEGYVRLESQGTKTLEDFSERTQLYFWKVYKMTELEFEHSRLTNRSRPSKALQNVWIAGLWIKNMEFLRLDKETQSELIRQLPSFKRYADPGYLKKTKKRYFCTV